MRSQAKAQTRLKAARISLVALNLKVNCIAAVGDCWIVESFSLRYSVHKGLYNV